MTLPIFGGEIYANEMAVKCFNTCPIDTWIALMRVIISRYPRIMQYFQANGLEKISRLSSFIVNNHYAAAKFQVAIDNNMEPSMNVDHYTLDFYSDERLFIDPYLSSSFHHIIKSSCSNVECPRSEIETESCTFPTVNFVLDNKSFISKSDFTEKVALWIDSADTLRCGQRVTNPVSDGANVFWDVNKITW